MSFPEEATVEFVGESLTGRRAVAALGVLAAVGLAAGYAAAVRARPKPIKIALASPGPQRGEARAPARRVFAHVAGAVVRPGVYQLVDGARVDAAVVAAGGARDDADLDSVNLAARVRDGDKVVVPSRGAGWAGAGAAGAGPGGGAPPGAFAPGGLSARVNLNRATEAELDTLPGIGPSLAKRIIAYREEHGGFRSVKDLMKVAGIGPRKFDDLEERVTV